MHSNTLLLAFDLVLLLFFGWMATWIRREYIMMSAAFLLSIVAIPLFMLLSHPTTGNVLLIRLVIITLGVAFAAPFYAWANSLLPYQWRYRTISLAIAFGSQLLGNPVNAISLWLYENTGCIWAPGAYLALLSFCGGLAVVLPFIVANKLTRSS
jgi:MHS family citrate/tricarballylate:H+ symporter-like MFS transporter